MMHTKTRVIKIFAGFLVFCCQFQTTVEAQRLKNPFFGLYSMVGGDPVYKTFEDQVRVMKETGYDGVEISQPENFQGMKAAIDKLHFHGAYFYFQIDPDQSSPDSVLKNDIKALKGTGTILAPYIQGKGNPAHTGERDAHLTALLNTLSAWAKASGLEISVYPHFGDYIQTSREALDLVKRVNRKNIGMAFNLCHWLATTPAGERGHLKPLLKEIRPYLKMITICGANDVITTRENIWDDYILPLGEGTFDCYAVLKYILHDLHFEGPVGVQCYGLKNDKAWLVKHSMAVWKGYKERMASGQ